MSSDNDRKSESEKQRELERSTGSDRRSDQSSKEDAVRRDTIFDADKKSRDDRNRK